MIILGIDTSCDETSVAVLNDLQPLSNVISTQVKQHRKFGGVVPFLAQRLHRERINQVTELALRQAKVNWNDLDYLAVTYGPGLAPALEVGLEFAKQQSLQHGTALIGVNHMWGHFASVQVGGKQTIQYPALGVLISGGHSEIIFAKSFGEAQIVGQTLDDALGEAYDKAAVMLGLSYPGGKVLAKLAKAGDPLTYQLPIPMQRSGDLNLSYSGLKNAMRLLVLEFGENGPKEAEVKDLSATFQAVANQSLCLKLERAFQHFPEVKSLVVGGGVAANQDLRQRVRTIAREYGVEIMFPPSIKLCTDNAAMIAATAKLALDSGMKSGHSAKLDRVPYLTVEDGPIK